MPSAISSASALIGVESGAGFTSTGGCDSPAALLMFGLGMNSNGTGLVLASMALAGHPRVLLPIIFYNLCSTWLPVWWTDS